MRWLKEGDVNSSFFHRCVNGRTIGNEILGLNVQGGWSDDPIVIKEEIKKVFENRFSEENWVRPMIDDIDFQKVDEDDNRQLIAEFSEEEVKGAVWKCDGEKSLDPMVLILSLSRSFGR